MASCTSRRRGTRVDLDLGTSRGPGDGAAVPVRSTRVDFVVLHRLTLSTPAREVTLGQLGFGFFLAVCVALHPGFVLKVNEGGVSNYGVHIKTALPFTLSLALPAVLTFDAAGRLTPSGHTEVCMRALLYTYSALIGLALLSTYPYALDRTLADVHIAVGIALVVFESVASVWMYRVIRRYGVVLALQLTGLVLAGLTIVGVLHLLFFTEVLSGAMFAFLLVIGTRQLS